MGASRGLLDREEPVLAGGSRLVVYGLDLAAAERRVPDAGGWIVAPIFAFPGGRRFHFSDLDGDELAPWSDRWRAAAPGGDGRRRARLLQPDLVDHAAGAAGVGRPRGGDERTERRLLADFAGETDRHLDD